MLQIGHWLRSSQMAPLSHGAMNCMAATEPVMHLLQFWQMDLLLPGEIQQVVTALKSKLRNVQVEGMKHSPLVPLQPSCGNSFNSQSVPVGRGCRKRL